MLNEVTDELIEWELSQGTPEWDLFRLEHDGASEARSMLGLSMKAPRSELMHAKHTGIPKEFSDFVRDRIFAGGHEAESMARPIMARKLGFNLYPLVCSRGRMSASCDGLDISRTVGWENKQWNESLATSVRAEELPEEYMAQPQQCLLVTGAERWIFTVSDGTEENMASMVIYPDKQWFDRIIAGWDLFHKDLKNYQPQEYIPASVAAPIKDLPAVLIEVKGEIRINDNLTVFSDLLNQYIDGVDKDPIDDQGFADMKAGITALKKAEDALESGEQHALAQISTFDEMRRMKKSLQALARVNRLSWEKIVVAKEKQIKEDIAQNAKNELTAHIDQLNKLIGRPYMPVIAANFADAMKNQRTLKSMREKVGNELVRAKMEASAIGKNIVISMNSLQELAANHKSLFSDESTIVLKANDDLIALIKVRISEFEVEQEAKLEAQRVAMQAEADRKAQEAADAAIAKVKAEQEAITASAVAEARAKAHTEDAEVREAERVKKETERIDVVNELQRTDKLDKEIEAEQATAARTEQSIAKGIHTRHVTPPRPPRAEIVNLVASGFGVSHETSLEWLIVEFA